MVITSDKCSFVNHKLHKNHFSHYEFNRPSSSICTKLTDMVHKSTNMLLLSSTNHCHLKQTYFNKRFSQCNIDSTAHTFNFYLTSLLLQLIQGVHRYVYHRYCFGTSISALDISGLRHYQNYLRMTPKKKQKTVLAT